MESSEDLNGDLAYDFVLGEETLAQGLDAAQVVQLCRRPLLLPWHYEVPYYLDGRDGLFEADVALHLHAFLQEDDDAGEDLELLEDGLGQGVLTDLPQHVQRLHSEVLIRRVQVLNDVGDGAVLDEGLAGLGVVLGQLGTEDQGAHHNGGVRGGEGLGGVSGSIERPEFVQIFLARVGVYTELFEGGEAFLALEGEGVEGVHEGKDVLEALGLANELHAPVLGLDALGVGQLQPLQRLPLRFYLIFYQP